MVNRTGCGYGFSPKIKGTAGRAARHDAAIAASDQAVAALEY